MAIWAFNDPNPSSKQFVVESLYKGHSRFGWSYHDKADLREIEHKDWPEMDASETETWKKSNFLLDIRKDDWVVHINVPLWGSCVAAKVLEEYSFDKVDTEISDFRHFIKIDRESLVQFDRNDACVHPIISNKLKLRGRYWRIYDENEFFDSIENVKSISNGRSTIKEKASTYFLQKEIDPLLIKVTRAIHKTHPKKNLEYFLAQIFRNIPGVIEVKENGHGWGTDYGADLIVRYATGIDILDLLQEETLVVQVKSYQGIHHELNCVEQMRTAIKQFSATAGIIITTAEPSNDLLSAVKSLSGELAKPIKLIAGEDVAKFVLKYEKGLLFSL